MATDILTTLTYEERCFKRSYCFLREKTEEENESCKHQAEMQPKPVEVLVKDGRGKGIDSIKI